jgi:hypothetical protein
MWWKARAVCQVVFQSSPASGELVAKKCLRPCIGLLRQRWHPRAAAATREGVIGVVLVDRDQRIVSSAQRGCRPLANAPVSRGSCAVSCTAHDHVAQGLKRSEYRLRSAPRFDADVTRCLLMTRSGPIEPGRRVRLFVFDGCRSRISAINPRSYHQT